MQEREVLEQELKSATHSYRTMPVWMLRIEEKIRRSKSQSVEQATNLTEEKKGLESQAPGNVL